MTAPQQDPMPAADSTGSAHQRPAQGFTPDAEPSHARGRDTSADAPASTQAQASTQGQVSATALAAEYAAKAGLHRTHTGQVDVLRSAGGVQGIAESIAPGLVFLIAFTITTDLTPSLIAALAVAAVFTVVRLIQRKPLTQALAGVVGVGISAWLANSTGKAEDFYLPGLITNAAYVVGMVISIVIKWPIAGLLFGFIRNEGLDWRKDAVRVRAYRLGTWIIVAVLVLRLLVQVPLYLMGPDGLAALATTRLIMGAPLYILGVWIAWLVTRPAPATPESPDAHSPKS